MGSLKTLITSPMLFQNNWLSQKAAQIGLPIQSVMPPA
jgi:hypothetical protein